jgi:hypothetical protein
MILQLTLDPENNIAQCGVLLGTYAQLRIILRTAAQTACVESLSYIDADTHKPVHILGYLEDPDGVIDL